MAAGLDCGDPLNSGQAGIVIFEIFVLLLFSHLIHLLLRRFGQPTAISQILAGILMGQTAMNSWTHVGTAGDDSYITSIGSVGRMFFMFLIGLESDIAFISRNCRPAATIALSGAVACALVAIAASPFLYSLTGAAGGLTRFAASLVLVLANSASPVLIRFAAELKIAASETGRLVISAALINDMACLLLVALISTVPVKNDDTGVGGGIDWSWDGVGNSVDSQRVKHGLYAVTAVAAVGGGVRLLVWWLNRRNERCGQIGMAWVAMISVLLLMVSIYVEVLGYSSMMACFVLGLAFPREGVAARTMMGCLTYPVYHVILPIYFGSTGIQIDLTVLRDREIAVGVAALVALGAAGKIGGTVWATGRLGIPFKEGLVVGFLMNVKGHVDLIVLSMARKQGIFGSRAYTMLLITVLISTLTAGPAAALIVKRERKARRTPFMGLQWLGLEREIRVLACVHRHHDAPTILDIIEMSSGNKDRTPLAAYLLHLVHLTPSTTTHTLYHQLDGAQSGNDDVICINDVVDAFTRKTGITLRQLTAVSSLSTMHEDIRDNASDVRASVVIVPFHKRQRIDGRMGTGKDGIRNLNIRILRKAPCTVGILVDRGMGVGGGGDVAVAGETLYHVAALFFGGADDRESLAYGARLAMNACVSVTVVRFLPVVAAGREKMAEVKRQTLLRESEVLLTVDNRQMESYADEEFMSDFYNRFVASGMVTYVERTADSGAETVAALSSMEGMFSLFIVGKGGRLLSPMTTGLTEWEECPELGPIGNLLASSEFMTGSVLVLQQHQQSVVRDNSASDDFTL